MRDNPIDLAERRLTPHSHMVNNLTDEDKEVVPEEEESVSGPLYPKLSMCFEGTRLTQLVQLVTAGRLFPCHKG